LRFSKRPLAVFYCNETSEFGIMLTLPMSDKKKEII